MAKKQKRGRSFFEAVQQLDAEDTQAEGQRQKASDKEVQKSQAAQSQAKIYSSLVECRILLQRSMTSTNDENDHNKKQKKQKKEESQESVQQCNQLLTQLLEARQKLLQGDAKKEEPDVDYAELVSKQHNTEEEQELLQSEYEKCRDEWKHVFNRRHRGVQLHAPQQVPTKFGNSSSILDASFWQQVESTVQYETLRRQREDNDDKNNKFDDSKVYQHLLKDFVTSNSSRTTVEASAAHRLRQKSSAKKDVDRRASKGRKIRYTPLPKLANFCFPQSRPASSNLDEDEWFRSLLGGVGSMVQPQES
jgi:protein AATF/BFR2